MIRTTYSAARELLPRVAIDDEVATALCATALGLGAGSPRVTLYAVQVARIAAALEGRLNVTETDAVLAGRLVLAPRASILPDLQPPQQTDETRTDETAPEPQDPGGKRPGFE